MKEIQVENKKIIKSFDHSAYKVVFKSQNASSETYAATILARNISTLIKVIDTYKTNGGSPYIVSINKICNCDDVYVGDLHQYKILGWSFY